MKTIKLLGLLCLGVSFSLFAQEKGKIRKSFTEFKLAPGVTHSDYLANTIVFKIKAEHRNAARTNSIDNAIVNDLFNEIGISAISKKFPLKNPPVASKNARGETLVDLSLIYSAKYESSQNIETVINKLKNSGVFEYVEPSYIYKTSYTPNDAITSGTNSQYYLAKIKAYEGWDISKGDTNTVIAIIDSGSDMDHPDLVGNFKKNYADPINGIDDDSDGYIDNFNGWDLGGADYNTVVEDNNPTIKGSNNNHGSHVSGCASATTDNSIGVAGTGFNSKLLIVKCSADNDTRAPGGAGYIVAGYEGIVYAADHGANIINCSWGGEGGGQFGQDIINYATFNQDALVIAAAGNDNVQTDHFPSSFDNVISVASTISTDNKSTFSNYGYTIDLCAPGSGIYATYYNNTYAKLDGTSMASPIAAGAAAIIKSHYPNYTALQVGEKLRVTCDNIYTVSGNGTFVNKLGSGRINLYKALTDTSSPSIVMNSKIITDNNDNAFVALDTLYIKGFYTNYLAPTTNLKATLTSTSAAVTVVDGTTTLGAIPTLGTADNTSDPFKVFIKSTAAQNAVIAFKLTFTDGAYTAVKMFTVIVNVDYINIQINDVATSITSKGLFGYNKDAQTEGLGFTYKGGASLLYEGGLMIGSSSTTVSDVVRGTGTTPDADFGIVSKVQRLSPTVISEIDVAGRFNDNLASNPQGLLVNHKAYAWSTPGLTKFVIVEYNIKNNTSSPLNSLYAGLFADWDILDYAKNKASYDTTTKMGYAFSTDSNLFAGIKVLTNKTLVNHYAIDNIAGGQGGLDISTGFDVDQKFTALSTNRPDAGVTGTGNDIIHVIGNGPFDLNPGDSVIVAFAILAGDSLDDLRTTAVNAQIKYDGTVTSVPTASTSIFDMQQYPNPASGMMNIQFTLPEMMDANFHIFNVLGKEVMNIPGKNLARGKHNLNIDVSQLSAGVYLCKLTADGKTITKKINIVK